MACGERARARQLIEGGLGAQRWVGGPRVMHESVRELVGARPIAWLEDRTLEEAGAGHVAICAVLLHGLLGDALVLRGVVAGDEAEALGGVWGFVGVHAADDRSSRPEVVHHRVPLRCELLRVGWRGARQQRLRGRW